MRILCVQTGARIQKHLDKGQIVPLAGKMQRCPKRLVRDIHIGTSLNKEIYDGDVSIHDCLRQDCSAVSIA